MQARRAKPRIQWRAVYNLRPSGCAQFCPLRDTLRQAKADLFEAARRGIIYDGRFQRVTFDFTEDYAEHI